MATYVNNLRLKEIATGDEDGTWGTSTNTNLELIGEALGYSTQDCFASDANATTTVADGATDPARALYFKVTSSATLTATRTLTIGPNTVSRVMIIENATTGSQSIAISQGSGANVTIPTGETRAVYLDGAGAGAAVVDTGIVFPGSSVSSLDINGGTIDGTTQASGTINGPIAAGGTWTAAATWTLPALTLGGTVTSNGQSFSGTIADLGTVTTADINGGTIDNTVIGGTTPAAVSGTIGTFSTRVALEGAVPRVLFSETDAGTDETISDITTVNGNIRFRVLDDAFLNPKNWLSVERTGTVIDSITYGNATDDPDHLFKGNVGIFSSSALAPLDIEAQGTGATVAIFRGRASDDISSLQFRSNSGASATGIITVRNGDFRWLNGSSSEFFRVVDGSGLSLDGGSNYQIDGDGNINVSSLLGFSRQDQTISSGAITVTGSYYRLDTEGGAATDDLDTINGGNIGDIVILTTTVNTRDIVVKDNTGNLNLGADFTLNRPTDFVVLLKNAATQWSALITRSN